MERSRLKNIIILILVLVNVSLLSSLVYRKSEELNMLRRTEDELVALFAASDVELSRSAISWDEPPAGVSMTRSTQREREFAQALLGENLRESSQGGISAYRSASGAVQFRSGGSFDAVLSASPADTEDFCKDLCRSFSFGDPVFTLDEEGSGTAMATYEYEKKPVYNCTLTFTISQGALTAISGTLLPQTGTPSTGEDLLSCAAALTAFQQMRREEGTVGSSISSTYLCYELQSPPSAPMALSSAWCIVTDIASYYVNCSTGAITVG